MIKTYPDKAAYEAAEKSAMESTVAVLENTGEVVTNGVNVVTTEPKVGDIVCYDESRKIRFIACDTYRGGTFPSAWETVGVVVLRKGNQVTVCSKHNEPKKFMEVLPYVVSGYTLDGESHSATINIMGKYVKTFTYSANTDNEFVDDLKLFLATNSLPDWSAYILDGKVVLQQDNYSSENGSLTTAEGLTLQTRLDLDLPERTNPRRRCGDTGWAVWHVGRIQETYSSEIGGTASPSSEVTYTPSYPVCWPAFAGTLTGGEDHCLWLRQKYCEDPLHPKKEEWYRYIEDIAVEIPTMTGGAGLKWRKGRVITDMLKGIEYMASDGTMKTLYGGIAYCAEFMDGKGYHPSIAELVEAFSEVTYGLSGVERAESDPINRSLYAIGGTAIRCYESMWTLSKSSPTSMRFTGSNGFIDGYPAYRDFRSVPFCDIDLIEVNGK